MFFNIFFNNNNNNNFKKIFFIIKKITLSTLSPLEVQNDSL